MVDTTTLPNDGTPSPMTEEGYVAILKSLPIAEAARGDADAMFAIARMEFAVGLGGADRPPEHRIGSLLSAAMLARMAASVGHGAAMLLLSSIQFELARFSVPEMWEIATAEAIAWAHRAAEAGEEIADSTIQGISEDPRFAGALAMAARMERVL